MSQMIEVKSLACPVCGEVHILTVDEVLYKQWLHEDLPMSQAFPDLTLDQREMLLTGLHGECWDIYLGPEPEDEDWEDWAEYGHDYYDEYYDEYPEDYDPYC